MRRLLATLAALICMSPVVAMAQDGVVVDYNNPRTYVVGGVSVAGNNNISSDRIIQITGLQKGMRITVPGDEISSVLTRIYAQRFFEDVQLSIEKVVADSAWVQIRVVERPRVSEWKFSGCKSGERKDIQERVHLRRGGEYSEYVAKTTGDIIKRYYAEKGYLNCEVTPQVQKDSVVKAAIKVDFVIDKGPKIKVRDINFIADTGSIQDLKEFKMARSMKKTKAKKWYNFFNSKKLDRKEYENDKKNLISAFNEAGYRDARIVRDSIYYVTEDRLGIDFVIDQGRKYYFRDVTWTGNSVYPTSTLNEVLKINKGDVYDMVTLQKRLYGGGKQTDYDVSKLYRDNGYLFFQINPVEKMVQKDSVDLEIRIAEGKPATINKITINGNDLTNEKVVRRQIFTKPGNLFSQSDFERSIREISSLGQFDPEAIMDPATGWSMIPNQLNNTVDLTYNVTEKPSSQLELSGGWGGSTFVATVGVSFNNFSTHRFFDKSAWRPVPLGDAQTLAFRFQTNGTYYTALTANFVEPWLFGKKPTSLNLSAYYTRRTNSYIYLNILSNDRQFEVYGLSASLGKRLDWPDNWFVMYNGLSWQTYRLTNWYSNYFIFDDGISHNLSYTLSLSRNSTDQQIYPRQGADISATIQLTPPFSLLRKSYKDAEGNKVRVDSPYDINYNTWSAADRYRWIEYHKWKFNATIYTKLIGDLVLMTRAQFGYLGYYNRNWGYSPFEGFLVGGDGMSGYNTYGSEVVALRGYENYSLTPYERTSYNSQGQAYAGNVYDKFTVELRYPVILQPQSTIFVLGFLEGGNCWSDIRKFNPFQIRRSAGVGVRVFLPMVGLLGIDWGYGFDNRNTIGGSQFHFVIGQQF